MLLITCLLTLLLRNSVIECKYHMSSSGMSDLIAFEKQLMKTFIDYYNAEVKRLNELEEWLNNNTVEVADTDTDEDKNNYISHPVHSFTLIKRFVKKWPNIKQFERPVFAPYVMELFKHFYENDFEDSSELKGSVYAIMKIQEAYNFDASELLQMFNNRYSQKPVLHDLFTIGYFAMTLRYFAIAKTWLVEAYRVYEEGVDTVLYPYNVTRLLESLVHSADQIEDYETAEKYSQKVLELHPSSHDAHYKHQYYASKVYWEKEKLKDREPTKDNKDNDRFSHNDYNGRTWLKREYKMCRGEEKMAQSDIDKLSCSYHSPNPEFILKPMKLEVAYKEPEILYFHDLLSDNEVEEIIKHTRKRLDKATVFNFNTGEIQTADYRISKSTFLSAWYWELIRKIVIRIGRVTNTNVMYSEPLQVANYGIGGSYESHFDHAVPPQSVNIFGKYGWGNRVATMLIYLSDVESGGNTVFVNTGPGVSVPVKKGAGVFWYNLKRNGQSDERTKHAGCPVLLGEKWIANLWIHEWGQEFMRPCALDKNL